MLLKKCPESDLSDMVQVTGQEDGSSVGEEGLSLQVGGCHYIFIWVPR